MLFKDTYLQCTRVTTKRNPRLKVGDMTVGAIQDLLMNGLHIKVGVLKEAALSAGCATDFESTTPEAVIPTIERGVDRTHGRNTPREHLATAKLGLVIKRMMEGVHDDIGSLLGPSAVLA